MFPFFWDMTLCH